MQDSAIYAERVLRAGAKGYLTKLETGETIVIAIRTVLRGEVYLSKGVTANLISQFTDNPIPESVDKVHRLSNRELQVLHRIGHGQTTRQIAQHLHLSAKTVENYRTRIKRKLAFDNVSELTHFAVRWVQDHEQR